MKSLLLRLFASFWLTMMLIGAGFAAIHALTVSAMHAERRANLIMEALQGRGERLARCMATAPVAQCQDELEAFRGDTDITIALYRDGERVLGDEPVEAALPLVQRAASGQSDVALRLEGHAFVATRVEGPDGAPWVVIGTRAKSSAWTRWLSPTTLPLRLMVLLLVTGVAAWLLARYLTRPLRTLRSVTQRIAVGELSARVGAQLGAGDSETAALGRDFDRMAERIESLLAAQQRLLRDVSHELRSPLTRLRLALELARGKPADAAATHLDRIERETERLDELIGQVLTITRLEADEAKPSRAELDLATLLDEVVDDVSFEAEATHRQLDVDRVTSATVVGNHELLRAAVENVLRNAVRFTGEGTTVDVVLSLDDGAAELCVRDRGPGVPDDAVADIFRPFYRVDRDRDRKTGGTGIGLAITDRAVRMHGGSLSAANASDGGLVIRMRLPIAAPA
jgi:two-component system sensor histidine kinase CpxA